MPSFEPMKPLPLESLRRRCLPSVFAFATTAELDAQAGFVGQHRAQTSLAFGAGIRRDGYNRFVMGPTGSGKHAMAGQYRRARAAAEARPDDWVYVNNFKHPHKPFAIAPAAAVARLIDDPRIAVPAIFEGDEYRSRGSRSTPGSVIAMSRHSARCRPKPPPTPCGEAPANLPAMLAGPPTFHRYQVNLVRNSNGQQGAPVVYDDHPTYSNLIGRIDHRAQFGALHRASGGYLLLDAHKVLTQPGAWECLKRALSTRRIRIESLAEMCSLVSTASLEPETIPLDVNVVLFGERALYYALHNHAPDFSRLFKVSVDFEDDIERGGGVPCVSSTEVRHAIDAQLQRADRVRDRMHESILRGTVMIDAACAWL